MNIKKTLDQLFKGSDLQQLKSQKFRTVYYDAWEHDSDTDPIISILNSLNHTDWSAHAKEALSKVIESGIDILKILTPMDLSSLKELLKSHQNNDPETIKRTFNRDLTALAPNNGQLVIFVDELDRCKPTYAVKLLERIKHYFNNPKVTFIFSVDLGQLKNTIKRYYGPEFDGIQYLDRFFDLVITLPEPDVEKYLDNTKDILKVGNVYGSGYYFKNNYYYGFCQELIKQFNFSLRQINHFYLRANSATYNLLNNVLKSNLSGQDHSSFIIYEFFLPFMVALSEKDIEAYDTFINGQGTDTLDIISNSTEFKKCLVDFLDKKDDADKAIADSVLKIYNAIFTDQENKYGTVTISSKLHIDNPENYKSILVNTCSLLSPYVKLD